jgi:FKBP-type peptidyl-prolyl cis-trans isomerase
MGQWISNNGFSITNPEQFKMGLDDVLLNKSLQVNSNGIAVRLDSYQKQLLSAKSTQQETVLFANLKGKSGIGMLPSGVGYFIMKNVTGYRPQMTDSVILHVKGFLPDGKLFEDTYSKKVPLRGVLATFIPGLSEALQIMPVGSTWRVFIPSALAYAETGVTDMVPPYSAVIFEVELINATRSR